MKDKILNALKTKYKNLGFSDTAFDSVASFLEASVTEEGQIDNSVAGVEILLKGFQGDADKRVTTAIQKAKAESSKGGEQQQTEQKPTSQPQTDEAPSWAKGLIERLDRIETGKTTESRKTILETKLANAVPTVRAKILKDFQRMNFEKDEDFDSYLTETEEDIKSLNQDFANQGLSNGFSPGVGGNQVASSVIDAEIKAWAEAK